MRYILIPVILFMFVTLITAGSDVNVTAKIVKPIGNYTTPTLNFSANQPKTTNDSADTTLVIATLQDVSGRIYLNLTPEPADFIDNLTTVTPLGKYLKIEAEASITNLTYVVIKINYTYEEVAAAGIEESSLGLYWWNENSTWEKLTPDMNWVYDTGVNTTENYVWANVSHFSYYGIGGTPISTSTSTSSSGGGGGGGGGGTSAEDFKNIEVKEKYDLHIFKDIATSYRFTNLSNPVQFINITGNISAGGVNVAVEVLKSTSSLVKTPAPGKVYKNFNIWVGTSGFATPRNIKNAEIMFRIKKAWVNEGTTALYRYDGGWIKLPTGKIREDAEFVYYAASTDRFSPFAIAGEKIPVPATTTQAAPPSPATTEETPAVSESPVASKDMTGSLVSILSSLIFFALPSSEKVHNWTFALILFGIVAALAAVYVFRRKNQF